MKRKIVINVYFFLFSFSFSVFCFSSADLSQSHCTSGFTAESIPSGDFAAQCTSQTPYHPSFPYYVEEVNGVQTCKDEYRGGYTVASCPPNTDWSCPVGSELVYTNTDNSEGACKTPFVDRADQCNGTQGQGTYATINANLQTVSCSDGPTEDCTGSGGVVGSTATYNYCQFDTTDTTYDHQTQQFGPPSTGGGDTGGGDTGTGDTGTGDTGTGDTGTGDTGTGDTGTGDTGTGDTGTGDTGTGDTGTGSTGGTDTGTGTGDTGTGTGGSTGTGDTGAGDCDPTATNYLDCVITSDFTEGEGGSFSSAGDDALQAAKDEYDELITTIKGEADSLLHVDVGQGGTIQPNIKKIFGVDVDFSWYKFRDLLVILGNIFFAVAAILAAFIILRR